jgi:hypothetical protein
MMMMMNEENDWECVCDQLPKNMGLVRVIDMKAVKGRADDDERGNKWNEEWKREDEKRGKACD